MRIVKRGGKTIGRGWRDRRGEGVGLRSRSGGSGVVDIKVQCIHYSPVTTNQVSKHVTSPQMSFEETELLLFTSSLVHSLPYHIDERARPALSQTRLP